MKQFSVYYSTRITIQCNKNWAVTHLSSTPNSSEYSNQTSPIILNINHPTLANIAIFVFLGYFLQDICIVSKHMDSNPSCENSQQFLNAWEIAVNIQT